MEVRELLCKPKPLAVWRGALGHENKLQERGIVRFPEFRSYLSIRQQEFPHWDMLPVTGYVARLPLLNHFGPGVYFIF